MLLCIELRGNQLAVLWPMVLRALVGGIDIVDAGAKDGFNPPSVRNSAKRWAHNLQQLHAPHGKHGLEASI